MSLTNPGSLLSCAAAALLAGMVLTGCSAPVEEAGAPAEVQRDVQTAGGGGTAPAPAPVTPLAGTSWRLVEIQSMDDAIGSVRVADPSLYTMRLEADGSVAFRLNCNTANGAWTAEPGPDPASGRFTFGPLAATMALCPPPSADEQVTRQAPYFRSYLLKDGRLYLGLMADGGIFVWERSEPGK